MKSMNPKQFSERMKLNWELTEVDATKFPVLQAEMRDAQARLAQNKRRSRKSNVLDEKRSGGADSRGSTPSDKRGTSTSRAASIVSDKGYLFWEILKV